ncbi:unnamed protein product [Lupinus luteus]|uniref:Myb/SANT-like DNA-binding domain-containing protein n=1 Tax=Lupinus luteus TaxID=3873 RepID=A0AAV1XJE6_LUPLU
MEREGAHSKLWFPQHIKNSSVHAVQQQQQNSHLLVHQHMVSYANSHQGSEQQHQNQSMKNGYPPFAAMKQQSTTTLSDEDEPGVGVGVDDNNNNSPKRKAPSSPWQRMKWTDTMVRLLVMAVYYIGDECGGSESTDPNGKKKSNGGLLQKKGKWKSVSRAMMEKGFYVSPQQCEDKFNDLNKRYKRVNDILGKGTACRVVENQNLLDTMDLAPKLKEEVRKLLNSKHLFFREMCAYHNSCGNGGGCGDNLPQHQAEVGIEPSQAVQQKKGCPHSSENGGVNFGGTGQEGVKMLKVGNGKENYEDDHDDDNDDDSDDGSKDVSDDDGNESGDGGSRGHHGQADEDENDKRPLRKKPRLTSGLGLGLKLGSGLGSGFSMQSQLMQQLNSEVTNVFQDGGRGPWEKKHWMRLRILQLEEQQIKYHSEALELEKQRLKWARFSSKKERDMERAKLENERRKLENERMVLLIKQKELELVKLLRQQQHSLT